MRERGIKEDPRFGVDKQGYHIWRWGDRGRACLANRIKSSVVFMLVVAE